MVDAAATGVRVGLPWVFGGITTPPRNGGSLIENNELGVEWNGVGDLAGNEVLTNGVGIIVAGTSSHDGNRIAGNAGAGIVVTGTAKNLHEDLFDGNGDLGIDLGGDGLDPVDLLDSDEGPHRRLNRPVLDSFEDVCAPGAALCARVLRGHLDAEPHTTYVISISKGTACNPTGYGEGGNNWLSAGLQSEVTTDASGHASFVRSYTVEPGAAGAFSALALDSEGRASEFSNCIATASAAVPGGINDLGIRVEAPASAEPGKEIRFWITYLNHGSSALLVTPAVQIISGAIQEPFVPSMVSVAPGERVRHVVIGRPTLEQLPAMAPIVLEWSVSPEWGTDPDLTNNTVTTTTMIAAPATGVPFLPPIALGLLAAGLLIAGMISIRM